MALVNNDNESQYGSIDEVAQHERQMSSFKRTSIVLLVVCGMVAGAGLFTMGQNAAQTTSAEVADVQAVFAEDAPVEAVEGEEAVITEGQDCPAGSDAPKGDECAPCPPGKHKRTDGRNMCQDCQPGHITETEGVSVPCSQCAIGKFAPGGTDFCTDHQICKGADGTGVQGVTSAGTASSDVVCNDCEYGYNTLTDDSRSPCYKMTDMDGDGLFDRLPPAWDEGMDFDRREKPGSGGEFDKCPFDETNDVDGDGICDGVVPLHFWIAHLEEHSPEFYPKGAWRVDQCPKDPTNNDDKDRKCDNTSEDDKVGTWDFYSNNMAGWKEKGTEAFEVKVVDDRVPGLDARRFIFDERVVEVCAKGPESIEAMFSITNGRYDWTENDERILAMRDVSNDMIALREAEKDERWRAQFKEDIASYALEIIDEKDLIRFKAHAAKRAMHKLEDKRNQLEEVLKHAETEAEIAEDKNAAMAAVKAATEELEEMQAQVDQAVDDLPSEIAKMKLANFLPPTCDKLCMDHNLRCTTGKIVYAVDSSRDTARGTLDNEIQAIREDLDEKLSYRTECEMWYGQAKAKVTEISSRGGDAQKLMGRAQELHDELLDLSHSIEDLVGQKKVLENQLSSCSPQNQEDDDARDAEREEALDIKRAAVSAKLQALEGALSGAKATKAAAGDDDEKRQAATVVAMVQAEIDQTNAEMDRLTFASTGCLDEAEEAEEQLQCTCSFDPEPIKEESWSMSEVCTTCHLGQTRGTTGTTGTVFTIKKNTLRFSLRGEPTQQNFVKITIMDKGQAMVKGKMPGAKTLEGRPYFQEGVSNKRRDDGDMGEEGEAEWYPVEWDLTEYTGRDGFIQIGHFDKEKDMSIDEFEFFEDFSGCLPSCMAVRDGVCNGGDETCFYFEEDLVPYVQVKSAGHGHGTFCRASFGTGTKLGGGIISMGYDYADWTDEYPTILPMLEAREQMVLDHDKEKALWLQKEKDKGLNDHLETSDGESDGWMMSSSEMRVELNKIDEDWEDKYIEADRAILAARNLAKDQARELTMGIDQIQLNIAEKYRTQALLRPEKDDLTLEEQEAGREAEIDAQIEGLTEEIQALKVEKFAQEDILTAMVGDDAGWAGAVLDYLTIKRLPRCMYLEMRGSHYAISLPEAGATLWAYEPEPSLDNGSVDGSHCVYNTIKPRCVAVSKGSGEFEKTMRATCKEEIFEGNCLNQCERFFCSSSYDKDGNGAQDTGDRDACGKDDGESPGAFDRCANCCGRLSVHEGWSSCLTRRRRRRLREAVKSNKQMKAFDAEGEEGYTYSKHECAQACLVSEGCVAYDVRNGACIIARECDAKAGEGDGFRTGKWMVRKGLEREQLGMEPENTKKKRKRRPRPPPAVDPEVAALLDEVADAADDVEDMGEGR